MSPGIGNCGLRKAGMGKKTGQPLVTRTSDNKDLSAMSDSLSPVPFPTTAVVGVSHEVPWASVLDAYLASALDSQHTRRAYRRHITSALQHLEVATLSELSGARLADFRARVTASDLSSSSQAQAIAALRSFLRWTRTMGAHRLPLEVVELALRVPPATVQRPYNVLSEPEIAAIISSPTTLETARYWHCSSVPDCELGKP